MTAIWLPAREKPFTVGICFSEFCGLDFEAQTFDAKLNAVISDSGFSRF